jgi:hypothetical protein
MMGMPEVHMFGMLDPVMIVMTTTAPAMPVLFPAQLPFTALVFDQPLTQIPLTPVILPQPRT